MAIELSPPPDRDKESELSLIEEYHARSDRTRLQAEYRRVKQTKAVAHEKERKAKMSIPETRAALARDMLIKNKHYQEMTEGMPPSILASLKDESVLELLRPIFDELDGNPDLLSQYQEILLRGDHAALEAHSMKQYEKLRGMYFGRIPLIEFEKKKKLRQFEEFVEGFRPVRSDRIKPDVFLSPRTLGKISSFGPQDIMVQSDRYVYGTFDAMPHQMAGNTQSQTVLSTEDIKSRAEIVMMDVADQGHEQGRVRAYLSNLFDYGTGKKIVAQYLALVFDTVGEAQDFLKLHCGNRMTAQHWKDGNSPLRYGREGRVSERAEAILDRMKSIHEHTGIVPPLGMEIRIPDSAKVAS